MDMRGLLETLSNLIFLKSQLTDLLLDILQLLNFICYIIHPRHIPPLQSMKVPQPLPLLLNCLRPLPRCRDNSRCVLFDHLLPTFALLHQTGYPQLLIHQPDQILSNPF